MGNAGNGSIQNLCWTESIKNRCIGIVKVNITVSEMKSLITLHVVSSNVILYKCLLGRNFISDPNFVITLRNNSVTIESALEQEVVDMMHICYVENKEVPPLNLNNALRAEEKQEVRYLFENHYINPARPLEPVIPFEMKISLKPNTSLLL